MQLRHARDTDARAIATIHVRGWQAAYRGLMPASFLDALSIDQREGSWRHRLKSPSTTTLLVEDADDVLGWISVGPTRDDDASSTTGEIYALYVSPDHWRRGAGRLLCSEALRILHEAGFSESTLWVVRDNHDARAFYTSMGFHVEAGVTKMVQFADVSLEEIRMRVGACVGRVV